MVDKLKLKATKRKTLGRKIKKLRAEGFLPANVYGKKVKSQALTVELKEFLNVFKTVGETGVVYLTVDKETKPRPVLVHNLQVDPVSDLPLHADFHQVDLTEKVHVPIPVELKGEAPAVIKGGVLVQIMDEIEVEALPTDLPESFVVDVSVIEEVGQGIMVKDLKVDKKKVKVLVENEEALLVKVEAPKEEKEEEKPVEAVEGEEGETAAEGEEGETKESEAQTEEGKSVETAKEQPKAEAKKAEGEK